MIRCACSPTPAGQVRTHVDVMGAQAYHTLVPSGTVGTAGLFGDRFAYKFSSRVRVSVLCRAFSLLGLGHQGERGSLQAVLGGDDRCEIGG